MAKKTQLSVVIPAYNEATRLGPRLGAVLQYLHHHYPSFELIVVDDGSVDGTAAIVKKAIAGERQARLISYRPNRGKGYAIRSGVLASQGDSVIFMDADMSTPVEEIPKLLANLKQADIVIGSRGVTNTHIAKSPPMHRRLASFIFDQIKFTMVGLRQFKDTQCGFKAYHGNVARRLFSKSRIDRFMFDVEILYIAEKQHLKIAEIPVAWTDMPDSKVRFWEGVVNMFRDLWRIRKFHSKA